MPAASTSPANPNPPTPRRSTESNEEAPEEQGAAHHTTSLLAKTQIPSYDTTRATNRRDPDAAASAGHGVHRLVHQGEACHPPSLHADHTVISLLEDRVD